MIYEFQKKIYLKVVDKFVEVKIEKHNNEFNVVPLNKSKIYIQDMPKAKSVSLEEAYKIQSNSRLAKEEIGD